MLGHSNKDNGLINNDVIDIVKDYNGFFWISTGEGFSRWDGFNFVNTDFAHLKTFDSSQQKITQKDIFTSSKRVNLILIDSNSNLFNVNSNSDDFPDNQDNRNFFCPIKISKLKTNSTNNIFKSFDSLRIKRITDFAYFETNEKSVYFKANVANDIFYIQGDTIKQKIVIDIPFKIFFCINNKLIVIAPYTKQYFVIENGRIINSSYLTANANLVNDNYWHVDQHQSFSVVGINNNLISFSLNNKNELELKIVGILSKYNYKSFYYDTELRKVFVATYNDGVLTFGVPLIVTKEEQNGQSIIYTQSIVENKIINNQTILSNLHNNWKTDQFFWQCVGPILSLNKDEILTGSNGQLFLLNKKLHKTKNWLLNNYVVREFLKTDSVIYFSNSTLNKYYPKTKSIKEYDSKGFPTFFKSFETMYASQKPHCIYAGISGNVYELNMQTEQSTLLAGNIGGEIRNLFYDTSINVLFISTNYNGSYFIKDKKIYTLPNLQDNSLMKCHYVLPDKDGDYWLPTNSGLYCMFKKDFVTYINGKIKTINYKRFGKEDGIINEEFNGGFGGAGLLFKDSIYLASMKGTVVFSPNIKYVEKHESGRLIIDCIKIDDSTHRCGSSFEVAANYKQIAIKASYPFFYNQNKFIEYRLLGSNDTAWYKVASDGVIIIKNINAGGYNLQVKAGNNPLNFKTIHFKINPYWYATWWAFGLLLLIILAIIHIAFMWRVQRLKNKNMLQMKQAQDKFFMTVAHDLKSPIDNFIGLADTIKFLIAEKDFEMIAKIGAEMDEKSNNLSLLLSNTLNWSILEQKYLKVRAEMIDLSIIINEILPAYNDIAKQKDIRIIVENNIEKQLYLDKYILSTIIRNLIDNAVKNADKNSTAILRTILIDNLLSIEVMNDAATFDTAKIALIKSVFNSKEKILPYSYDFGLGLILVCENAKLMNAKVNVIYNHNKICFEVFNILC